MISLAWNNSGGLGFIARGLYITNFAFLLDVGIISTHKVNKPLD